MAERKPMTDAEVQEYLESLFTEVVTFTEGMCHLTWRGGFHPGTNEDGELHVYEEWVELVGGKSDGAEVFSGYFVNLEAVLEVLRQDGDEETQDGDGIGFNCTVGVVGATGPEAYVSGAWRGIPVTVYFHSCPPADAKAGLTMLPDGSIGPKDSAPEDTS